MPTPAQWLQAARLRTLPLSLASILLGSLLSASSGIFSWLVFALGILTTVFLQALSNYANDLGDTLHGADSDRRKGPARLVQSGVITASQMKGAVILMSALSLVSGLGLLAVAFTSWAQFLSFLALGLLSIGAAILYTNGKKPYGYAGLGDASVFIFFGMTGVLGIYLLHGGALAWQMMLPAGSAGLLAVGVLNVNNLRDVESDKAAGKLSVPVRIGFEAGKTYHKLLVYGALIAAGLYAFLQGYEPIRYLFVVAAPLLIAHTTRVGKTKEPHSLDPELKRLALLALLHDLLFGLGQVMA